MKFLPKMGSTRGWLHISSDLIENSTGNATESVLAKSVNPLQRTISFLLLTVIADSCFGDSLTCLFLSHHSVD